ncbi:MAG: chloride channel protein [Jatrophihabitans sp.]|uniref:chloride channel protein n=1 Tax=Jatrophihabitans sp. TaxID=1932789 RepID=UPI003F7E82B1
MQHLAFGYTENTFLTGVEQASSARRVLAVGTGGLIAGLGWWWLHRRSSTASVSVTHALATPDPRLGVAATVSDALLQIVAVGSGASLGREGAPRQVGASLAGEIARRCRLTVDQRRILLAAGAGAGLAAVYNVPLGGAVFSLEILLTRHRLRALLPTVVAALIATVVAWPFLGTATTYHLPTVAISAATFVAGLIVGVLAAPVGMLFRAGMTRARTHAPSGWRAAVAIPSVFSALGAVAIVYPQLLGNGKNMAELAFAGVLTAGLAAILSGLKPVATGACLRSGAIGGLLTPSFATGAAFGALLSYLQPAHRASATEWSLLGAAAVLAVAQRAPWTAIVLALEFTGVSPWMALPIACAVGAAKLSERTLSTIDRRMRAQWNRRTWRERAATRASTTGPRPSPT